MGFHFKKAQFKNLEKSDGTGADDDGAAVRDALGGEHGPLQIEVAVALAEADAAGGDGGGAGDHHIDVAHGLLQLRQRLVLPVAKVLILISAPALAASIAICLSNTFLSRM